MVRHIYLLLFVSVTALSFSPSAWAREEEGFGVGWLWIPVVIGLVWFMNHMYERHRSSELRTVAQHMGFQFLGKTPSSILRSNFKLAEEKGTIRNLLRGVRDNVEIEVLGYEVSTGENTTTTTIVAFRSASLELPRFELYPKGTFGMVATAFGALVVDFAWRPGFSGQFVLKGDKDRVGDEDRIRTVFTKEVMDFLSARPKVSAGGNDQSLIYFVNGYRASPGDLESFVDEGLRLVRLFAKKTRHGN
ncbi:MAG: hypothetical protein V3U60_07735 [Gammaproteobacteria bacterium]